ncbi:hypothetical protein CDD80_2104 [Ophiocordyceps camponoti-rufipedis]|uniref:Uncharacterized protein n=1 Tax=Ophiocordyceps camponoti-rufipedis TaxID=2004952 RepID=A0A2C5XZM4_9HYPO|nr:hypothetical protein CDD80_2104 [Ophiocordyceps camponoti-rufipedis]
MLHVASQRIDPATPSRRGRRFFLGRPISAVDAVDDRQSANDRRSLYSISRLAPFAQRNSIWRRQGEVSINPPSTPTQQLHQNASDHLDNASQHPGISPDHLHISPPRHRFKPPSRLDFPIPNTRLIADTKFPWLKPDDPALADIEAVSVVGQKCRTSVSQQSHPPTTAGVGTRKRPAESTEIDLIAGLHKLPSNISVTVEREGQSLLDNGRELA